MTAKATYNIVVLFEDEVRLAARLLRGFFDPERELSDKEGIKIIEVCYIALQGAEAEDAVLVLGRKPVFSSLPPAAGELPKKQALHLALLSLKPEERREVMAQFCSYCGSDDPRCQCWNDE